MEEERLTFASGAFTCLRFPPLHASCLVLFMVVMISYIEYTHLHCGAMYIHYDVVAPLVPLFSAAAVVDE